MCRYTNHQINKNIKSQIILYSVMLFIVLGLMVGYAYSQSCKINTFSNDYKENLIRFHVLANSDSEEDQALKLKVRDKVISYLKPKLEDSESISQSEKIILNEKDKLMDICKETIKQNGYNYDVSINLGYSKFPTKQYSSVVLPAGEYKSLKIIIGKGQGKNWWCVMFPPLCFVDEQNNVIDKETDEKLKKVLTKDEYELIVEKDKKNINNLQIKFKIVEVFQKILNLEKEDKISIINIKKESFFMGRYYKIVLSFVLAIFMMTNTIFAYGEKSLNIINITHLFKQIQQIKFAQLESSTLQSQYKFDLSENTMDKKLVKITIPNLQDTKNKSIKDYSTLANNTQQTKEAEKEDTEECQQVMNLSDEQINLLSKLVAAEARGESYEGQVAVAAVVLNRVQDSRFPDSIEGVIYQKNAFSVVRNGYIKAERTEESDKAVKDALYGNDPTNNAIYFWNPDISTCNWINTLNPHLRIGNHVFAR